MSYVSHVLLWCAAVVITWLHWIYHKKHLGKNNLRSRPMFLDGAFRKHLEVLAALLWKGVVEAFVGVFLWISTRKSQQNDSQLPSTCKGWLKSPLGFWNIYSLFVLGAALFAIFLQLSLQKRYLSFREGWGSSLSLRAHTFLHFLYSVRNGFLEHHCCFRALRAFLDWGYFWPL